MFLEQLKTGLAAVITLQDELTPDKSVIGSVFLNADTRSKPVEHETGRFILTNTTGVCRITYGGHFYHTGSSDIDLSSLDPKLPLVNINLSPRAHYPFPKGMTLLRGEVVDTAGNKPIAGATITVQDRSENTISDDDGSFYIRFDSVTSDLTITVNTVKDGFQPAINTFVLKKERITRLHAELATSLI